LRVEIPAGDNRLRYTCNSCTTVHYENPKLVVGCVPVHNDRILLCKRAIEPRLGFWTLPAGFMEMGESLAEAAARETLEEACADVAIGGLLASVNVLSAGQVHVFFRATLASPRFAAGAESLEVQLVDPAEIPWGQLAFTSNRIALEQYLLQRATGQRYVWTGNSV
jgi:ADP-ribose pyrophosphatase YjhB (NUDIX family)